jgi:N-acyl amino acid synthase of PEP-CTERM/exosortase system
MALLSDTKMLIRACMDTLEQRSFKNTYNNTFELLRAELPEHKGRAHRLRYKIYCEENRYECSPDPGNYMEQDEYDDHAIHFLLLHKISRETVGTLRVILPRDDAPGESFPMQKLCDHPLLKHDSRALSLCEISRFCMAPRFRKREQDGQFLASYSDPDLVETKQNGKSVFIRRQITYPQAALWQGAFEAILEARILDCIWMVEPCHLPSLSHIGFPYRVLGPKLKVHGGLQPVIFNIKHVLDTMRTKNPACWEIISDSGRLQDIADGLARNDWQDALLDDVTLEQVYEKLA